MDLHSGRLRLLAQDLAIGRIVLDDQQSHAPQVRCGGRHREIGRRAQRKVEAKGRPVAWHAGHRQLSAHHLDQLA